MNEILNLNCSLVDYNSLPIVTIAPIVIDIIHDNNLFEITSILTIIMICPMMYVILITIIYYGCNLYNVIA